MRPLPPWSTRSPEDENTSHSLPLNTTLRSGSLHREGMDTRERARPGTSRTSPRINGCLEPCTSSTICPTAATGRRASFPTLTAGGEALSTGLTLVRREGSGVMWSVAALSTTRLAGQGGGCWDRLVQKAAGAEGSNTWSEGEGPRSRSANDISQASPTKPAPYIPPMSSEAWNSATAALAACRR